MRKKDYFILAQIIKRATAYYSNICTGRPRPGSEYAHQAIAKIAYEFSNASSVKKDEFLQACGIKYQTFGETKMTHWNTLSNEAKIDHNTAVNTALIKYKQLSEKVKTDSAWLGKNEPPDPPFGSETVETRKAAATAGDAKKAMLEYEALLAKYRDNLEG